MSLKKIQAMIFFIFIVYSPLNVIFAIPEEEAWTSPVVMQGINTKLEEWSPCLSPDGLSFYFSRLNREKSQGRIYMAARDYPYGSFSEPTLLTGEINIPGEYTFCPWISEDNLRIYYHSENGGRFYLRCSQRSQVSMPWPQGDIILELIVFNNRMQCPRLSADERILVFTAQGASGGVGGYDMWMATRDSVDDPFGHPIPLNTLNTTSSDIQPWLLPDGLTIYFSSNRSGNFKLYRATRSDRTVAFGEPEHLSQFDTIKGHSQMPCVTPDQGEVYFMRELPGGRSTRDICVAYRIDSIEELLAKAQQENREAIQHIMNAFAWEDRLRKLQGIKNAEVQEEVDPLVLFLEWASKTQKLAISAINMANDELENAKESLLENEE